MEWISAAFYLDLGRNFILMCFGFSSAKMNSIYFERNSNEYSLKKCFLCILRTIYFVYNFTADFLKFISAEAVVKEISTLSFFNHHFKTIQSIDL